MSENHLPYHQNRAYADRTESVVVVLQPMASYRATIGPSSGSVMVLTNPFRFPIKVTLERVLDDKAALLQIADELCHDDKISVDMRDEIRDRVYRVWTDPSE